jgi:methyl-accepting chemotaxis protein
MLRIIKRGNPIGRVTGSPIGGYNRIVWDGGERLNRFDYERPIATIYSVRPQLDARQFVHSRRLVDRPYSGWTPLPDVRASWQLTDRASVWAAASRAIRSPEEIGFDRLFDGKHPVPPGDPSSHAALVASMDLAGAWVELAQPVVRDRETLGTLYLKGHYDIASRVYAYLGIFGLVMVLSMIVAYALSKRLQQIITAPLDATSIVAREIVDRRDYSLRARKITDDEFGLVVDAFNNMLQEVQMRALTQEETNRQLLAEIADRGAAEEAMREADRRKDEFLATLAHELRNPLAPIRHAVKLLESAKTGAQQQQWAREVIARQMQRMALMLDDLLEVSRITRGR